MTNKQLKQKADEYFNSADIAEWRISDAALYTGLTHGEIVRPDRNGKNYEAIRYIKLKLESAYELRLNKRGNSGDVFALKCLGWTDKDLTPFSSSADADRISLSELCGDKF